MHSASAGKCAKKKETAAEIFLWDNEFCHFQIYRLHKSGQLWRHGTITEPGQRFVERLMMLICETD